MSARVYGASKKIARELTACSTPGTDRPQQRAHTPRQRADVAGGELARIDAGGDHQCLDEAHVRSFPGRDAHEAVETCELLEVRVDLVHEQRIEHITEELPRRRRPLGPHEGRHAGFTLRAHADDEQPVRAHVDRRRQRSELAHRAVAVVLGAELHGREQHRNPEARHQVIETERIAPACARGPRPVAHRLDGLVEGDRPRGAIARGTQRHTPQLPACETARNARPVDLRGEQTPQGRIVEQCARRIEQQTTGKQRPEPAQPGAQHAPGIGVEDLGHFEVSPHRIERSDGITPAPRLAREHAGRHGSGRRAHDHRKGIAAPAGAR